MAVLSSGLRRASAMAAGFTCDPPASPRHFFIRRRVFISRAESDGGGGRGGGVSRYRAHPSGQSGSVGRGEIYIVARAFERSFLPLDIRCYREARVFGKRAYHRNMFNYNSQVFYLWNFFKRKRTMESDKMMYCIKWMFWFCSKFFFKSRKILKKIYCKISIVGNNIAVLLI